MVFQAIISILKLFLEMAKVENQHTLDFGHFGMVQWRVTPDRHSLMLLTVPPHFGIGIGIPFPHTANVNDGGNCYPKQGILEPHRSTCCGFLFFLICQLDSSAERR